MNRRLLMYGRLTTVADCGSAHGCSESMQNVLKYEEACMKAAS